MWIMSASFVRRRRWCDGAMVWWCVTFSRILLSLLLLFCLSTFFCWASIPFISTQKLSLIAYIRLHTQIHRELHICTRVHIQTSKNYGLHWLCTSVISSSWSSFWLFFLLLHLPLTRYLVLFVIVMYVVNCFASVSNGKEYKSTNETGLLE